jgi:hypothetical protein
LARYYRAGTAARFVMFSLTGQPRRTAAEDLEALLIGPAEISEFAEMEHSRIWLLQRNRPGTIVALDPDDQPAILLHFEALAQSRGMESISFQVPSINVVVMHHLLERGYKIDAPPGLLMSSRDFGQFDRFVPFAPAIVL